jgi:signal transduction histidine kinase/CheY-like chemotaxis protein
MVNFETVRLRKDGQRIAVTVTESPIRNERGHITGISSIARDITERKKLENKLLQSQKMEAVGRLAGGVAHDFNNILTAILGYSDLLLRQIQPGNTMHHQLSEIKKAGELAAALTHQLLAFSRRQDLQPKVVSLNDAINNIQKMLRRLIDEDIRIMILLDKDAGHVKADPAQLDQVMMNLAVNARDAMPRGGILTIETSNCVCGLDDACCQTQGMPPGEYVKLSLSDTGTGMTEEVKQHLFEPFFTTKEKGQGTGLGLATCYGIVKQSGGYIVVESSLGQGSSFHVYLPRVNDRGALFPAAVSGGRMPHGNETILLVEDEASVRTLAAQVLRRLGYSVIEAADGEGARHAVQNLNGSRIDLLLADVVLPSLGGRELLDLMEENQLGVKVLFTSGYVKEIVCKKYDLPMGVPFLQKPFTPADLARKVREIIES